MGLISWWRSRRKPEAIYRPVEFIASAPKKPAPADELVILAEPLGQTGCVIVGIEGTLSSTTAAELEIRLQSLLADRQYRLIVDFARVTYVSSRGWGILISLLKEIREHRGDIKLIGMQPHIAHLFRQAGLASVFEAWPDRQQAAAAFTPPT
jgi:anti-anti-sigma factor